MSNGDYPKGAGLGCDTNKHKPTLVDFDWTMKHGSRAQRREIIRQMRVFARQGVPGAREHLADMEAHHGR